ncbi:MAG: hypothetical protein KC931_20125 [Candidatus Omnitrophica bacterium]|nr:hypothetical protein [Candidatus Omnitrophota bacterium]
MPARGLDRSPQDIEPFDVVGQRSETLPPMIGHVGLAIEAAKGKYPSDPIPCRHMYPPLRRSSVSLHVWGSVTLNQEDIDSMEMYLEEIRKEYKRAKVLEDSRRQYIALPHVREVSDELGRTLHRKFSCAGLVLETYRYAEIDLVNTDDEAFPRVSKDDLRGCYPVDQSQVMSGAGLDPSQTEWPVLLPAYLFHSLDRPDEEIRAEPYLPQKGDWFFPRVTV